MFLKACLNGNRLPGDHPRLPVTPQALAAEVASVVAAGADAVHLHPKSPDGADTLAGPVLASVLEAVRAVSPKVGIGVTTGAWAASDVIQRVARVRSWTAVPDFASVNYHEEGADDVAAELLGLGVGVEAGLWHLDAADAWLRSPYRDRCCRVLLELPDGFDTAATKTEADRLLDRVHAAAAHHQPILLHGAGSSCWPALRYAVSRGLQTRIGLEDTLSLPDGSPAPDNVSLVQAALALRIQG